MKQTDLHTYAGKVVSQPSGYGFAAIRDCSCVVAGVIDEPAYREHAAEKRFEFRSTTTQCRAHATQRTQ